MVRLVTTQLLEVLNASVLHATLENSVIQVMTDIQAALHFSDIGEDNANLVGLDFNNISSVF